METYYATLGINKDELIKRPVFVLDEEVKSGGSVAATNPYAIEMKRLDGISDEDWRIFTFMYVLGHERYHGASKTRYFFDKRSQIVKDVGLGLHYKERGRKTRGQDSESDKDEGLAVEEGLAYLFEKRFGEILKKQFPTEKMKKLEKMKSQVMEIEGIDQTNETIQLFKIQKVDEENATVDYATNQYPSGARLVEFLEEQIPDFRRLAEIARIRHDSRGLAKACRDAFGEKEAYRKIVTTPATKEDVENLMMYLRERLEAIRRR